MSFCNTAGNCCPANTYCTVDIFQNGACCAHGASCTGLSSPVTELATGSWPASSAASAHRAPRVFVGLAHWMNLGLGYPVSDTSASDGVVGDVCFEEENLSPEASVPGADIKKGGGCSHGGGHGGSDGGSDGGHGTEGGDVGRGSAKAGVQGAGGRGATGGVSETAPVPLPLKFLGFPFVLARHAGAAIHPTINMTSDAIGKLKLMGANEAMIMAQNKTSSAASMPRPRRVFGLGFALIHRVRAATLPIKTTIPHPSAVAKFIGGNAYYLEKVNYTSNAADRAQLPRVVSFTLALARHIKNTVLGTHNVDQ
ncbi:hypothetical protein Z517_09819 [Fonsecaea pedrosoi CBS 271.37]|uniref:Uncharacterized protein n=1 Tax=Fonsecaea pedrosoi CBS 271.37 TaxID=1442368 RepID=A0A0D2G9H5_9EURO|nr:uncharacterized protein Z517_09819 [Fonsecaea pedrosoi CBS 271.37]KIW77373.1 hypothetical protein Z517_09819 [Fonsecaea pedrosoi CBS 271.37]